ncbi:MAG: hypothetical protein ONB27_10295 [candidate division KSB1 bacterium]|nr:hypothetical protein [candidate division KSB1 bacterium]
MNASTKWIAALVIGLLVVWITDVVIAQTNGCLWRRPQGNLNCAATSPSKTRSLFPPINPQSFSHPGNAIITYGAPLEIHSSPHEPALDKANAAIWISLGPEGGWIGNILMHPTDHNVLWAHTANSYPTQFFKSTNNGTTWSYSGSVNDYVYASTNDPTDPAILYAATGNYVYKSQDGGATWTRYQRDTRWSYIARIYVCPTNHNLIYAAGYYYSDRSYIAFYKSTNGGQSWTVTEVSPFSYQNGYGYCFAADPKDPNVLYIGGETYDGSLWNQILLKSTDGGTTWSNITGAIYSYAYAIAVDPNNTNKIYVGTSNGVYRSRDAGSNWEKSSGYVYAYELAIDPKKTDIIYAGGYEYLFKSTDAGETWTMYSNGLVGDCTCLLVDHTSTDNLFYGSIVGVFKSSNGGVAWATANSGIIASSITAMAAAPSDPRILYIEFDGNAVYKTTDSGNNWTRLQEFLSCGNIGAIAVHPTSPNIAYALEGAG